ncbi:glutamate racemase [Weissella kandleri]|uniref:glutamate racemase n=1 Tax=Weissella kandleri TaxID=1616 RepID=UPI00387E72AD
MDTRPIGYLDSGLGGLTAVRAALELLPNEDVVYVGDTARMPYGPRPQAEVLQFTRQIINFLLSQHVKAIVIACNTATAAALPQMQAEFDIPIFGVINAGVSAAAKITRQQKIGVIATEGTVKSNRYRDGLQKILPTATIHQIAAPKLVQLVEKNVTDPKYQKQVIAEQLAGFKTESLDTLILGCTHFPLLAPQIQAVIGPDVQLVDSGAATVLEVQKFLDQAEMRQFEPRLDGVNMQFYTTGAVEIFEQAATHWLNRQHSQVKHLALIADQLQLG